MLTLTISAPVGRGGVNLPEDVATVQELLNLSLPADRPRLRVDGNAGARTVTAIEQFQSTVAHLAHPDGRIDPLGRTWIALTHTASPPIRRLIELPKTSPPSAVTEADYARTATDLGCEVAAIKAVAAVEARGAGFHDSRLPKILFEAHQFSRFTDRRYDRLHPGISSPSWNPALYAGGEAEYPRLYRAMLLDRSAALKAASWGRFQIMGFNHALAGHPRLDTFVNAMFRSELDHLKAFAAFLVNTGLTTALRRKDWAKFAKGYNGPEYAQNAYDKKMKDAYDRFSRDTPR